MRGGLVEAHRPLAEALVAVRAVVAVVLGRVVQPRLVPRGGEGVWRVQTWRVRARVRVRVGVTVRVRGRVRVRVSKVKVRVRVRFRVNVRIKALRLRLRLRLKG